MPTNPDAPGPAPANKWEPWSPGDYAFEVIAAEERLSKRSERPMIELRLRVFDEEGGTRCVLNYLR